MKRKAQKQPSVRARRAAVKKSVAALKFPKEVTDAIVGIWEEVEAYRKEEPLHYKRLVDQLAAKVKELEADNLTLREALEFYARDPYNQKPELPNLACVRCGGTGTEYWEHPHNGSQHSGPCFCTQSRMIDRIRQEYRDDGGKRARATLALVAATAKQEEPSS